jgi:hypothetical protein
MSKEQTYNDYPKAATSNAQKAIDWKEKYGRDVVTAGTEVGWQRAHQLAKGESLSEDVVSRMAQFNRHRKNSKIAPEFKDEPWKDRGYVAWLIWGGDEGVDWAMETMGKINKEKEVTEWLDTCESYLYSLDFLYEGKLRDLQMQSSALLQKLGEARQKTGELRQKVTELKGKKADVWKIQIAELNIKKNDLKIQMLSIADIVNKLKMRYVTEGLTFSEFLIINESLKKLDI